MMATFSSDRPFENVINPPDRENKASPLKCRVKCRGDIMRKALRVLRGLANCRLLLGSRVFIPNVKVPEN